MKLSHGEMMVIIQGLRLINGLDQLGGNYEPTEDERGTATSLLLRIDEETG